MKQGGTGARIFDILDVKEVLDILPRRKAPGPDGITNERLLL